MTHTGTVQFKRDVSGEYRMQIRARNGRKVGPTEGFTGGRRGAARAFDALQRALVNPRIVWVD